MHINKWISEHEDHSVYLACPYSHKFKLVERYRHRQANKHAAYLMKRRIILYSPISHTPPICWAGNLPGTFDYWRRLDEFFLSKMDVMLIVGIRGWQVSNGICSERLSFKRVNKPCYVWHKDDQVLAV